VQSCSFLAFCSNLRRQESRRSCRGICFALVCRSVDESSNASRRLLRRGAGSLAGWVGRVKHGGCAIADEDGGQGSSPARRDRAASAAQREQ
jgi:hypothetical protein